MKEVSFKAPWGAPLCVMTVICVLMCVSIPLAGLIFGLGNSGTLRSLGVAMLPPWLGWLFVVVPLAGIPVSAAFMVRGYVLTESSLLIKRLCWKTRFDLSRLTMATVDPEALQHSLRLFGNGGFFSFTGWYRNKKLGVYHAYATDTKRAVVLRFSDKTVVVTPDDPQKFVAAINSMPPPVL